MANNTAAGAPNVWTQMGYTPPRGQCNHKPSLLAAKCPCLRFMLHPLKSSSSYECDGCGHHASFHTMENRAEDEIRRRWEVEAAERRKEEEEEGRQRPKKRQRAIEYNNDGGEFVLGGRKTGRAAARAKSKTPGEGRFIELD
ncbi:hypothetical protein G6011_11805 [Alternaria panax]|uniref:Uncharacterized protein n=1 Tax=Alternaria panax TaxID=48097 RepID=A0AAD4F7W6_9PLEO|nr:hypothetical protein G6011_11805 [Alternaria panax]